MFLAGYGPQTNNFEKWPTRALIKTDEPSLAELALWILNFYSVLVFLLVNSALAFWLLSTVPAK